MSFYSCQEERCTRTCFLQYKHTHKQKEDSSKMYINFKEEFSRKEVKNNDDFSLDGGINWLWYRWWTYCSSTAQSKDAV